MPCLFVSLHHLLQFSLEHSLDKMVMMYHHSHSWSTKTLLLSLSIHLRNHIKRLWFPGTWTWWYIAPTSPVTAICFSLNLNNTPPIRFVRPAPAIESLLSRQKPLLSCLVYFGLLSIFQSSPQEMLIPLQSPSRSIHPWISCNLVEIEQFLTIFSVNRQTSSVCCIWMS